MTGVVALHEHGILEVFQHRVFFLTRNGLSLFHHVIYSRSNPTLYSALCLMEMPGILGIVHVIVKPIMIFWSSYLGGSTLKTGDSPTSAKPEKGVSSLKRYLLF